MTNFKLGLFILLILSACNTHVELKEPVVETHFDDQVSKDIRELATSLESEGVKPIYLFIGEDKEISNQSGAAGFPNTFKVLTQSIAADFKPKVEVITSSKMATTIYKDPDKTGLLFEVEGAITAFDQDNETISSGIDFGVDTNDASNDNRNKNKEKISEITLDIFFKQNGRIYAKRTGSITIKAVRKGYNFGFRVNNAFLGFSQYKSKQNGLGKSLRTLLSVTLKELIEEVHRRKNQEQYDVQYLFRKGGSIDSFRPITRNDILHAGDQYKIIFTPPKSAYVYIYQKDSQGEIFILHPSSNSLNPVETGKIYTLPGETKSFTLDASTGKETIYFVSSPTKIAELEPSSIKSVKNQILTNIFHAVRERGQAGIVDNSNDLKIDWRDKITFKHE